jgi:hypothetical protein
VKLTSKNLSKQSGFYCGYLKRRWVPGRVLPGKYFYSHSAERANLQKDLKKVKGKKKKTIQNKIAVLTQQINNRSKVCAGSSSTRIRFDLTGATGLALANESQSSSAIRYARRMLGARASGGSNLKKVLPNGVIAPALVGTKRSVTVSKFLVGPNNKLYVLFTSRTCLEQPTERDCSNGCLLSEVDTETGETSCIDDDLNSISWDYRSNSGIPSTKPLQFDAEGNLYYLGNSYAQNVYMTNLRRYSSTTKKTEDLINQNIQINGFLVLRDGSILLSGTNGTSGSNWLRKKLPGANGAMQPIGTFSPRWMAPFPDGRVYMSAGYSSANNFDSTAILRINPAGSALDTISWSTNSAYFYPDAYNLMNGIPDPNGFSAIHQTPAGRVYALGGPSAELSVAEIYPHPHKISVSIPKIQGMKPIVSDLIIFGTDNSGNGKMILYNTTSESEVDLLGGQVIEVYRAEYQQSSNSVQFDGLRFSDGAYVLCTVNIASPNPVCSPTGSTQLADFQSISTPGVGLPPAEQTPTPLPLLSFDMTGAKAITSIAIYNYSPFLYRSPTKLRANGTVERLSSFDAPLLRAKVRSDQQGNIWLSGPAYLTDTDTTPCRLSRINNSTGAVTCVYQGSGMVGILHTSTTGRTYFTVTLADDTTELWSSYNGTTTRLSANLGGNPTGDILTSDDGILLAYANTWVKKVTPSGTVTTIVSAPDYYAKFGALQDGTILVPAGYTFKRLTSAGSAVLSEDWLSDVGCSRDTTNNQCGYFAENLFSLANGSTYSNSSSYGFTRIGPGSIAPINLTHRFAYTNINLPNSGGSVGMQPTKTQSSNTIFFAGKTTGAQNKITAFNTTTETEQDLTDDATFIASSMTYNDGKLYLLGYKAGNFVAAVKDLSVSGGTTLTTLEPASYYNLTATEIAPVIP